MANNLDAYEEEYLERLKLQDVNAAERLREERLKTKQYVERTAFTAQDYILLESIRREDPRIRIRMGTMKVLDGLERLYHAGWIKKPNTDMPFDDLEKLEKFRDSYEYKQYTNRLRRIMTHEYLAKKSRVFGMLKIKKIDDWLVLTEDGVQTAEKKRDDVMELWNKMQKLHSDGMIDDLKHMSEQNRDYLPLLVMMGITNWALMGQLLSNTHGAHYDIPHEYGMLDVGSFDAGGFDIGGW